MSATKRPAGAADGTVRSDPDFRSDSASLPADGDSTSDGHGTSSKRRKVIFRFAPGHDVALLRAVLEAKTWEVRRAGGPAGRYATVPEAWGVTVLIAKRMPVTDNTRHLKWDGLTGVTAQAKVKRLVEEYRRWDAAVGSGPARKDINDLYKLIEEYLGREQAFKNQKYTDSATPVFATGRYARSSGDASASSTHATTSVVTALKQRTQSTDEDRQDAVSEGAPLIDPDDSASVRGGESDMDSNSSSESDSASDSDSDSDSDDSSTNEVITTMAKHTTNMLTSQRQLCNQLDELSKSALRLREQKLLADREQLERHLARLEREKEKLERDRAQLENERRMLELERDSVQRMRDWDWETRRTSSNNYIMMMALMMLMLVKQRGGGCGSGSGEAKEGREKAEEGMLEKLEELVARVHKGVPDVQEGAGQVNDVAREEGAAEVGEGLGANAGAPEV
ncbi:hypothetical protein M427DRAFT_43993 [Gonapodya prolifera JEL478]|uniref:Uncharacterized protein n=1 Tax=Gonapodya prolifera (strain JEL478) TaxID=1344416 RepID=A0A139AHM9_GONPJ|nr:hypothetical protein M427DRAFT_43993 [Gonapodya prolifera JEL478]|eukprot:KXS16199.1 hypothetical protein M427DRAFT_43993 [Gonapodya prolifera JEL478]